MCFHLERSLSLNIYHYGIHKYYDIWFEETRMINVKSFYLYFCLLLISIMNNISHWTDYKTLQKALINIKDKLECTYK